MNHRQKADHWCWNVQLCCNQTSLHASKFSASDALLFDSGCQGLLLKQQVVDLGVPSEERGVWWGWLLGVRFMRACWKGLMPKEAPVPENRAGLASVGSCRQCHV